MLLQKVLLVCLPKLLHPLRKKYGGSAFHFRIFVFEFQAFKKKKFKHTFNLIILLIITNEHDIIVLLVSLPKLLQFFQKTNMVRSKAPSKKQKKSGIDFKVHLPPTSLPPKKGEKT